MTTPEERDQLITTYCATFKSAADKIAQRCEVLLAETNELFSDEQKTDIRYIQDAARKLLSEVGYVRQPDVLQRWVSTESKEFEVYISSWIHDVRSPIVSIRGFSQFFLDGNVGSLTKRQREEMEYVNQLGQGLFVATNELLKSLRRV